MTFKPEQIAQLDAPLSRDVVKKREGKYSYIEGWHAIAEANRIFGFGNWSRETIETRCVTEREREIGQYKTPGWGVSYVAKVRISVWVEGAMVVTREGVGAGHGIDKDLGQAHESAIKESETDAMKRALMTFGNPFGLALYDKEQTNVEAVPKPAPRTNPPPAKTPASDAPKPSGDFVEEDEPVSIPTEGKSAGEWGKELIAKFKAAPDMATLMAWKEKNLKVIDQLGPKAKKSVEDAYAVQHEAIVSA